MAKLRQRDSGAPRSSGSAALRLLAGVSAGALILGLSGGPARAQLAAMRAAAGTIQPPTVIAGAGAIPVRPVTMQQALQRAQALQSRADALAVYVTSAQAAARASLAPIKANPVNGIATGGLDPIAPVRAATLFVANGTNAATATANAVPASVAAVNDPTGLATWEGALAPVQSADSSGNVTVRIDQTQERALLSWNTFDVGAKTTVSFNQKLSGVAQPGWTVVNRILDNSNPTTILGSIKADGTVLILNSAGVLFGPGSQVNLNSLIASSLDIGNFASQVISVNQQPSFVASSIKDRNTAYLQNGLLVAAPPGYKGQLLSALLPAGQYAVNQPLPAPVTPNGDVTIYSGAAITTGDGGFLILAAPTVTNAGTLSATDGQVSLQAGLYIGATPSTGAANSADPNVRGLILSSQVAATPSTTQAFTADQGIVTNYGLIDSTRGYLSLGTSVFGQVTNAGLLRSTTSVSRNGKIALLGGTVTLLGSTDPAQASGLVITPDTDGEVIPQGTADSPPAFKTSQIVIGDSVTGYLSSDTTGDIALFPSIFGMGQNAFIYAPSANVVIGHDASQGAFAQVSAVASAISIANAATIDVSGVKDVQLSASRNSVKISPVKGNELRDTPNYRSVTTDGSFTLNGSTLYVDPRVSGVRSDGVAWVGSPLIEAGSAISQIPVTAAELMTKGGAITMDLGPLVGSANLTAANVPAINIAKGAIFDVSGGWVSYAAGNVVTSQLITADGRIVDIGKADPNDSYVGVVDGFTSAQPKFGLSTTYANATLQGSLSEAAYDEGRDAGALTITSSNITFDGTIYGQAFAGANQLASAIAPTKASAIAADPRKLQLDALQLPSGALFRIGSFTGSSSVGLGGDIVVYHGTRGSAASDPSEILLDDQMLSSAGLSALLLQTSGSVLFAGANDTTLQSAAALTIGGASNLTLAAGGTLEVDAGRSIGFDGNVTIAGGTIAARTYQLSSVTSPGIGTVGSAYRSDDDVAATYAVGAATPHPFDLTVNGTLSVAGRWTNDYLGAANPQGSAWIDGGAISLTVAPKALVPLGGTVLTATQAGDLSGSLYVNAGALLDVSSGGYVSPSRKFDLSGTGGDVSLINQTTYATVIPTIVDSTNPGGSTVSGQSVAFTPLQSTATTAGIVPTAVPLNPSSVVRFAPGTIKGFGFAGGGTFTLISPDIALNGGGNTDPGATQIPLDFLKQTGFGTLDITAYHSRIVQNLFDNASPNASAFFDTTRLEIGAGQTLDLTQVTLPTILDTQTQLQLAGLATGSNVATALTPLVQAPLWYRQPANLVLRGLTELDVDQGGQIVGAPLAAIVAPKLYNDGSIVISGGTISQLATLPAVLNGTGFGLTDAALGGSGFDAVFGAPNAQGQYLANGINTAGFIDLSGSAETNSGVFTNPDTDSDPATHPEHFLYFLGRVGANDGIVLSRTSVTNLSGIALYDPTAAYKADGTQYRFGKVIAGGSIGTASIYNPSSDLNQALFTNPRYGFTSYPDPSSNSPTPPPELTQTAPRAFMALPGSQIDVSGASGTYDQPASAVTYAPTLEWSDAGTVALAAGGSLSGSIVNAHGGASGATGGTLVWLDPTIQAVDTGTGAANVAFADQITNAGFSSLVAYGGLTLDGQFSLKLGKSLLVESAPAVDETRIGGNPDVTISATAGTGAAISAPYIHFSSRSGTVGTSTALPGSATVSFTAGAAGLDLSGGILFDASISSTYLTSATDIRLIGVDDRNDLTQLPVLDGSLVSAGDLIFNAQRVYTTTGTGNLQRILENAANPASASGAVPSPYLLSALGSSQISFLGGNLNLDTPLSAGSYLQITADRVVQNGYLAAPLGRIDFGTEANPVTTVVFGANSVTSVSAGGKNIPYGTTTDLTEYYFNPGATAPITQLPSGDLRITSRAIRVDGGATVNGSGGGDVFAYEFVSGTGGSRDVLSRFNNDAFSSNNYDPATGVGTQYADGRQVYAIVPAATAAKIAMIDPVYSADYGASGPADLYGAQAGLSVTLDGGGGIPAGQYVLLPAHYALLPGAYRVVQNTGAQAPAPGVTQTLLDGSVIMGGSYSTAGTGFAQSQRYAFTIESQSTLLKYSNIQTTSGTTTIQAAAASAGIATPRLPLDAARVVLAPIASLTVDGVFNMTPASGGRGSEVDILGKQIRINHSGAHNGAGLVLTDTTIANLNANSLLIGGQRVENSDDTTQLLVSATHITVESDANLAVPELVLAVAGVNSSLTMDPGATLVATGTLADNRAGDYVISSVSPRPAGSQFITSGIGSVLRIANGAQRMVDRQGSVAARNTLQPSYLTIGAATIGGQSLMLDTSRYFDVAAGASLNAGNIGISADTLVFSNNGGAIDSALEAKIAAAANVVLRSPDTIAFDPGTTHAFNNLTLDTPGLSFTAPSGGTDTLVINAADVRLQNSSAAGTSCTGAGQFACGTGGNSLTVNAATLTFGSGTFGTFPFDGSVSLTAAKGAYFEGAGVFDVGSAALSLTTPFLIDRAAVVDPRLASPTARDAITPAGNYTIPVTPAYQFATTGAVSLIAPALAAGTAAPTPAGLRAPGAHLAFGSASAPVSSLSIGGVAITATAGVIDVRSTGAIAVTGAASLATPGYSRSYGTAQGATTVSAGGGTVNLISLVSDITLASASRVIVDNGIGNAGTLNLLASEGGVTLDATLNPGVTGSRLASLNLDSQTVAFDLDAFATQYGARFGGDLALRSGTGDLTLGKGNGLRAASVSLTADGGLLTIAGTIDTSGVDVSGLTAGAAATARVNGGDIALWGMNGVTLAPGARLDTHTTGYLATDTRQASAGNVTIGIGDTSGVGATGGAITIAAGATLDLGARRTQAALAAGMTGNRLVPQTVRDPNTLVDKTVYNFVAADTGGTLSLRAPLVGAAMNQVDVRIGGSIVGAGSQQVEAYRTYDLAAIAAGGQFDGVTATATGIALNAVETGRNFLSNDLVAGGMPSIVHFVRNFAVSALDGTTSLTGMRLRPGIDLVSPGDIALTSNWNLAAGIVDEPGAAAAGVLAPIPELGLRSDGTPYYALVSGHEGNLLANYTNFLYRVGGKASGEAGAFNVRAAGNINVGGANTVASISDGFFTFGDKSDPLYIDYQLGGGNRIIDPAARLTCGSALDCSAIATYTAISSGATIADPTNTATISLARLLQGSPVTAPYITAPYNPVNNSAAALGTNTDPNTGNPSGDPLGFAQLFPLLADGSVVRSSSLRLTAGTGSILSSNPLHIDGGTQASLTVAGSASYGLAPLGGTLTLGNTLDLQLNTGSSVTPIFSLAGLIGNADPTNNANQLQADSYTTLTWGGAASQVQLDARQAAKTYFANLPNKAISISGVTAPLIDIIGFLTQFEATYIGNINSHTAGYPAIFARTPEINFGSQTASVSSMIRTGDGSISVAASGNIDLTNGALVYRNDKNVPTTASKGSQIGGTAIYTAGHRIAASAVLANVVGTGAEIAVTPTSPFIAITPAMTNFIPSPKGLDDQAATLAVGGGAVSLVAGGSVLGRRDVWSETYLGSGGVYGRGQLTTFLPTEVGDANQRWRPGIVGQDTEIAIAPKYFTSGVGTLGGGDVTIRTGGDVSDLTVVLDTSVTTTSAAIDTATNANAGAVMMTLGSGNLSATIGGSLAAGQIDLASGSGTIATGASVVGFGNQPSSTTSNSVQYLRLRLADATLTLSTQGSVAIAGISALGASPSGNARNEYYADGFFSPAAGASIVATGDVSYVDNRADQTVPFQIGAGGAGAFGGSVLPPSLTLAALTGTLTAPALPLELYPSSFGELRLFSAGDLNSLVIAMSDSEPSLLPGAFSAAQVDPGSPSTQGFGNVVPLVGLGFGIPGADNTTSDALLRLYHSQTTTHLGDGTPIEIFAGNDIATSLINVPKLARITAGHDILNLEFTGQNVAVGDTTLVSAGHDITGTTLASPTFNLPYIAGSNFVVGGPGSFFVQAGRNVGPFLNSATVGGVSYAGGIQTVGNDLNPWFAPQGADLTLLFGVAPGIDYTGLRDTYLDPANFAKLDGDLFVQVADALGNLHPDRTEPVYAPILATWLRSNAPTTFTQIFGTTSYPDTTAGNAALTADSYGKMTQLYTAFVALDPLLQDKFLINDLYFHELQQPDIPTGPSYLQYIRGYRAIAALFPAALGYTDNLAAYTTDPATVNADHPLGVPTRTVVNGQPVAATEVHTGNVDLRLATLQTSRGGDVTILGPGGTFIAGSVVRTSEQAARRVTRFGVDPTASLVYGQLTNANVRRIDAIPIGYEGMLTLRGGAVSAFTDGDFRVNQSRVFTQAGGDITLWSSNGDLNAGQGPKTASNFPPIVVRFNLDAVSEVDSAGSVAGAGIGTFKRTPSDPGSTVYLLAPVGLVDAGDAGVRASGDIFVAAARVANADAFSAGGSISGVPSLTAAPAPVAPGAASSATAATIGNAGSNANPDRHSQISVDVLGYAGSANVCDEKDVNDPNCKRH